MRHHEVSTETLLLYATGQVAPDQSAAIEAHLRECPQCTAVIEEARSIADVLREQQSLFVEPPAHVATMAEQLFGQIRPDLTHAAPSGRAHGAGIGAGQRGLSQGLRRILADVTFDSLGAAAFAGLRAAAANARHLAYQSELGDLDLQVTPPPRPFDAGARWRLMGQLELNDPLPAGTSISFLPADLSGIDDLQSMASDDRITADVDSRGYFIAELQSGTWAACVVMEGAVLVFPGITI